MNDPRLTKIDIRLEEEQVIKLLISWGEHDRQRTLDAFLGMLHGPVEMEQFNQYEGFYVADHIQRTEMGFNGDAKPGDFDVVIIPFCPKKIYFERTVAYEVKIVRPTRKKMEKNANSMGVTQLKGLIQDGFPLVSLMHITMPEPLMDREKMTIELCNQVLDMDNPKANIGIMDDTREILFDWFGSYSADKQIRRLLAFDIPKYAGLYCASLELNQHGNYYLGSCTQDYWHFQQGYFNPHVKIDTVSKIRQHFDQYRHRYQTKLRS